MFAGRWHIVELGAVLGLLVRWVDEDGWVRLQHCSTWIDVPQASGFGPGLPGLNTTLSFPFRTRSVAALQSTGATTPSKTTWSQGQQHHLKIPRPPPPPNCRLAEYRNTLKGYMDGIEQVVPRLLEDPSHNVVMDGAMSTFALYWAASGEQCDTGRSNRLHTYR